MYRVILIVIGLMAAAISEARAQGLSEILTLERPGQFSLRLFATGYGSDKYGTTHQGLELNQSITRALGLMGRFSAYQIYEGTGFDNPLTPAAHSAPRNFGRFDGGVSV